VLERGTVVHAAPSRDRRACPCRRRLRWWARARCRCRR
jgi:hypothetical protein